MNYHQHLYYDFASIFANRTKEFNLFTFLFGIFNFVRFVFVTFIDLQTMVNFILLYAIFENCSFISHAEKSWLTIMWRIISFGKFLLYLL